MEEFIWSAVVGILPGRLRVLLDSLVLRSCGVFYLCVRKGPTFCMVKVLMMSEYVLDSVSCS